LRETGFFRTDPIMVDGRPVRPIDVTAKLLFPMIKLGEGEEDITVMLIRAEGIKSGLKKRLSYSLIDKYDPVSGIHSMARTTGYAATMAARLLARRLFINPGIHPPENLAKDEVSLPFILSGLKERGVIYNFREEEID
jgi:lysine 6-dehydrogenase